MGVTEEDLPSLWVLISGETEADLKIYKSDVAVADLTVAAVTRFVDDVKNGTAPMHVKITPEAVHDEL